MTRDSCRYPCDRAPGALLGAVPVGHPGPVPDAPLGALHHVEVWVADLAACEPGWAWLLGRLGYQQESSWPTGRTYRLGATYVVVEQSPDVLAGGHQRRRAGINHLAFHAGSRENVDAMVAAAGDHGWHLLFPESHPHAGGAGHYAAFLEDSAGYEVELVAR